MSDATAAPLGRRIGLLLILSLTATSSFVDRNVLGVLIEPIKAEFHATDTQIGLLTGFSFALLYALLGLPVARWADRGHRPRIIALAMALWSAMTLLSGYAGSFAQLALARVGVGIGEAGALPPAQSLIADHFAPRTRGRAFAVFTLASTVGYLLAYGGGGWIAAHHGWRAAFLAMGAPGILLALLVLFGIGEPRQALPPRAMRRPPESVAVSLGILFGKRAYRLILGSMILYYALAYGALTFTVPFILRVHHRPLAETGAVFGGVAAAAALAGTVVGGIAVDLLARRDQRWLCWLAALGLSAAWPLHLLAFVTASISVLYTALFVAIALLSAAIPAQLTALHAVIGSTRRASAIAVAYFFTNLLGLGLGPLITGRLSDALAASVGPGEALRIALLIMITLFVPSAALMVAAARRISGETEA